jgi:hypothetical protein
MWYKHDMAKRYSQHRKHVFQSITIFILVLGIAGLGTLKAGQLPCEPDCSMHQPRVHQASCCDVSGTSHVKILTGHTQEKHQASSSNCDGTFCIESSLEELEIAVILSSSLDTTAASQLLPSSLTNSPHSPQRSSCQVAYPVKQIPIYMLTCTYLI